MSHLCRVVPDICGTYIRTLTANRAFINELVTSDAFIRKLAAQMITLQDGGVIKSSNYNGDIKKRNGTKGFALDSDGNADFVDMHATGGVFTNITANNMTADGGTFENALIEGTMGATVFHFNKIFSKDDNGYTDSAGIWHNFQNGDMWLVEA